jgi:hypothetical protein
MASDCRVPSHGAGYRVDGPGEQFAMNTLNSVGFEEVV